MWLIFYIKAIHSSAKERKYIYVVEPICPLYGSPEIDMAICTYDFQYIYMIYLKYKRHTTCRLYAFTAAGRGLENWNPNSPN